MSIKFFYDNINYRVRRSGEIKRFLEKVIRNEGKIPGDLFFIFTDDKRLIIINREFLKHDYFTDVIAFNNSDTETVNGEIYISAETVKRNSGLYNVGYFEETLRVMIHGVLHLCGYEDKDANRKKIMTSRQEAILNEFLER